MLKVALRPTPRLHSHALARVDLREEAVWSNLDCFHGQNSTSGPSSNARRMPLSIFGDLWHNSATNAAMGTSRSVELPESPGRCEPGQRKRANNHPGAANRNQESVLRVGETEPSFVIKDADMDVSGRAPEFR